MRTHSWILLGIALAGCVTNGDEMPTSASAPPTVRQGPKIVSREAVDWAPLAPIVSIQLANLRRVQTKRYSSGSENVNENFPPALRQVELKVFPQQKLITFSLKPNSYGATCVERGQYNDLSFVASPGADVSDQVTCNFQGTFERWRVSANYQAASKFSGNTLTIDGKARIRTDALNTFKGGRADDNHNDTAVIDLHGSIQINGATCRVISWRHTESTTEEYNDGGRGGSSEVLEATPATTCTVTR